MILLSEQRYGFVIIRVKQENSQDTDFSLVEEMVTKATNEGNLKIALSLDVDMYPYSKIISSLIRCSQIAEGHNARWVVVQPNADFIDVMNKTRLSNVFKIVSTELELEAL